MLNQQRVAEQLEQIGPVPRRLAVAGEFAGERLHGVEDVGDLSFVAPEHDALGQRVGNDQQPFQREFPNQDGSTDRDRLFGFLRYLYLGPFFLVAA